MAERDLINAFDDCIERLNEGETLDTCLRAYPQFAAELRPMLLAGQVVRQARIDMVEVQAAQARGRERLRFALQANPPVPQRRANTVPFVRLLTQAAAIILILGVFLGGTALAAESSLPGDPLYGYKRLTENVRLTLPGDREALAEQFAQRRVDEIRQLLAIERAESVDFSGVVESMTAAQWQVAGLRLQVPEGTPDAANVRVNDFVAVQAYTTTDGLLTAEQITLIEQGEEPPLPTATDLPTQMPTETLLPTATATPTVAPTNTQPPLPSATTMPPPTQTPAAPASTQAAPTQAGGSSMVCIPTPLPGWVAYSIRSGDTLSGLASQTGITLDQLMTANCLTDARLIVAGQQIWLPFAPSRSSNQSGSSDDDGGDDHNSGSSNSGSGSRDNDDDSGSSNSGSGSSDDDDGGSSGSGGGDDDDD